MMFPLVENGIKPMCGWKKQNQAFFVKKWLAGFTYTTSAQVYVNKNPRHLARVQHRGKARQPL
jgi:hypothetical protein